MPGSRRPGRKPLSEQERLARAPQPDAAQSAAVLRLQASAGNAAVQRLARREILTSTFLDPDEIAEKAAKGAHVDSKSGGSKSDYKGDAKGEKGGGGYKGDAKGEKGGGGSKSDYKGDKAKGAQSKAASKSTGAAHDEDWWLKRRG
jgi:hypothetical protein